MTRKKIIWFSVSFAGECSNTLLCVMHKLGHCGGDARLKSVIVQHLETRECFNHEESDISGRIADFKRCAGLRDPICLVGRAIPHRGGHPIGRLVLRRRRPVEEADAAVPARRARIEVEENNAIPPRDIPVIVIDDGNDHNGYNVSPEDSVRGVDSQASVITVAQEMEVEEEEEEEEEDNENGVDDDDDINGENVALDNTDEEEEEEDNEDEENNEDDEATQEALVEEEVQYDAEPSYSPVLVMSPEY